MWKLRLSATSATPISTRNASASILVVGYSATNAATGPDDRYITAQAMITAATMIRRSCAMPIAVMTESNEKMMSITTIWKITHANAFDERDAITSPSVGPSTSA